MVWELGKKGSGGRTALVGPQQDSDHFLRTKRSMETAPGEGPECLV